MILCIFGILNLLILVCIMNFIEKFNTLILRVLIGNFQKITFCKKLICMFDLPRYGLIVALAARSEKFCWRRGIKNESHRDKLGFFW